MLVKSTSAVAINKKLIMIFSIKCASPFLRLKNANFLIMIEFFSNMNWQFWWLCKRMFKLLHMSRFFRCYYSYSLISDLPNHGENCGSLELYNTESMSAFFGTCKWFSMMLKCYARLRIIVHSKIWLWAQIEALIKNKNILWLSFKMGPQISGSCMNVVPIIWLNLD